MTQLTKCPTCGADAQEAGKFCEQCGGRVPVEGDAAAPTAGSIAPTGAAPAAALPMLRFIRVENGVLNRDHAFDLPVGANLLVGRTDPANGVFPDVDVTMWSQRVQTSEGALYTIHRKQCYITRDDAGTVWIRDVPAYEGDTLVSPANTSEFRTIPALGAERDTHPEAGVRLEAGDRILMGQGEGMLVFQLIQI